MGFRKFGFFFFLLFFHHLHLLLAHQHSQNTQLDTEFKRQQNASEKANPQKSTSKEDVKQKKISVSRRGGGGGHGGGHGGGGGHGSGGGHGEGGQNGQGHGAVIPLYAAGAGGYHGNDRHHHGSNTASPGHCGLSYFVFSIFISLAFVYFI